MQLLTSNQFSTTLNNIIHEGTQVHEKNIDLTVDAVHKFTSAGSLDFGGGEFEKAKHDIINPEKINSDDDYGWWELSAGRYKAIFNENISLGENIMAAVTPHYHAQAAGLLATTKFITKNGPLFLTFDVPEQGCNIKENARLATLYLFEV